MQLSSLRTEILNRINNDTNLGTTANINAWINLAQDEAEARLLARHLQYTGTFATETDVSTYVIVEPYFRSFVQLWQDTTPAVMKQVDARTFRVMFPDPDASGTPLWWVFKGYNSGFPELQLYYIPDTSYVINYEFLQNLPDLSANSDESIFSRLGWDEILIQGAFIRYLQAKDPQRYGYEKRRYDELLTAFRIQFQASVDMLVQMNNYLEESAIGGPSLQLPPEFPGI